MIVDKSKAPASTIIYTLETNFCLWCACTGPSFINIYYCAVPDLYFQIKAPLTSVTSTQFSSTYTFYVVGGGTILFPTFTTIPSPTTYTASKFNLIVDESTLSSLGIATGSTLSWLTYDST